jgi:dihydrofolate reductase
MTVRISMIAAVAENGVIGSHQTIPWRIPSDFAYFKRTTMGKPIIMGRKQYETVGKPLPGRANIVVTRQESFAPDGVIVVGDLEQALEKAKAVAQTDGVDEIMIIGGGDVYAQFLEHADRLYISHVDLAPEGEIRFPPIDLAQWVVVDLPELEPHPKDEATYRVKVYERRDAGAH